jgi:hypothetical protein
MLHACFTPFASCFVYTLWCFYAISRTDLSTRCYSASSLYSAIFMFQKSYTGNILEIGRNKFRNSYFPRWRTRTKREPERGQRLATPQGVWPSPWPHPPMVRPPWSTSDDAPSPIKSLLMENPKGISKFLERVQ